MEGGLFDKLSLRSHSKSSSKCATKESKDKKDKREKVVSPRALAALSSTITEKVLTSGILSKIFGFLAPKDLLSVGLTCKRWHESFQIISAPLRRKNHGVLFYTKPEVEALLSGGEASSAQENIERTASKSTLVTNHSFHDKTLTSPTFCIICTKFIWGLYPTAAHCKTCDAYLHKKCFKEEFRKSSCPFPQSKIETSAQEAGFDWKSAHRSTNLCRLAYLTESELHVQAKEMGLNVLHFINDKKYDTQGFIAVDDAKKQVILSFTGTVSIKDIWTDVQCSMVQFPELKIRKGPVLTSLRSLVGKETAQPTSETDESHDQRVKGCEVHAGFCRSYLSVADFIVLSLISIYAKYTSYELHITGHSLGGALATLAAVDLHIKVCPPSISVFTVGQPRVGNRTFVQLYSEIVASSWRLVNFGDQVPKLPPPNPLWPYKHTSTQILYGRRDKSHGYCLNPFGADNAVVKCNEKKRWSQAKELNPLTTHTSYMAVAFPSRPQLCLNKSTH